MRSPVEKGAEEMRRMLKELMGEVKIGLKGVRENQRGDKGAGDIEERSRKNKGRYKGKGGKVEQGKRGAKEKDSVKRELEELKLGKQEREVGVAGGVEKERGDMREEDKEWKESDKIRKKI